MRIRKRFYGFVKELYGPADSSCCCSPIPPPDKPSCVCASNSGETLHACCTSHRLRAGPKIQTFWQRLLWPRKLFSGGGGQQLYRAHTAQRGAGKDKINGLFLTVYPDFPFLLSLDGRQYPDCSFSTLFSHTNKQQITDWGNKLKHNKRRQKRYRKIARVVQKNKKINGYNVYSLTRTICLGGPHSVPVCICYIWLQSETKILRSRSKKMCIEIFKKFVKYLRSFRIFTTCNRRVGKKEDTLSCC